MRTASNSVTFACFAALALLVVPQDFQRDMERNGRAADRSPGPRHPAPEEERPRRGGERESNTCNWIQADEKSSDVLRALRPFYFSDKVPDKILAEVSKGLGEPMVGISVSSLSGDKLMAGRGW